MNQPSRKLLFLWTLILSTGSHAMAATPLEPHDLFLAELPVDYFTDSLPSWTSSHSVQPRATCTTGKPCGNSCISMSYTCHIGTTSSFIPIIQTITFQPLPTVSVGSSGIISANGGLSGYPVVFTSVTPSICTVTNSGTVTGISIGICTITANQAGNSIYSAANQAATNLSVKAPTAIAPTPIPSTAIYNRILNWAEQKFPTILTSKIGNSTLADGTIYRCYPSNFCVGYRQGRVLTFDGINLMDVGGEGDFLPLIQADGF